MKNDSFPHKFVDIMPSQLEDGILYISIEHVVAIHKCACGCGNKVVTPISPSDWQLLFDGEVVSLSPSIGNWDFNCKSHYWIRRDNIVWAKSWSESTKSVDKKKKRRKKRKK